MKVFIAAMLSLLLAACTTYYLGFLEHEYADGERGFQFPEEEGWRFSTREECEAWLQEQPKEKTEVRRSCLKRHSIFSDQ